MKAVFVTTPTLECGNMVTAWNSWSSEPAVQVLYDITGAPRDSHILKMVKTVEPDVIFYIGGVGGRGLPHQDTLKKIRDVSPSIHLCWDATDDPWHKLLQEYHKNGCFDLQVALDGGDGSPGIDMGTLTPVDPHLYDGPSPDRTIPCGFAGQNASLGHPRFDVLNDLVSRRLVTHRAREEGEYSDYVDFLRKCQVAINFSHCGSGKKHHVKIRIVEIALSGAALLESIAAPTPRWLPEECMYFYRDNDEVAYVLRNIDPVERLHKATLLGTYVRENYSPEKIYKNILERLDL